MNNKRENKIKWIIAQDDKEFNEKAANQIGFDRSFARILMNRGLIDPKEIEKFLDPRLDDLVNPLSLQGVEKAVSRIKQAFVNGEKILIYGDYDVDGIASTSLLFLVLKDFTSDVYYYIPDRSDEGYGISKKGIDFAIKYQISLMITVDCGISSFSEIKTLRDLGIDTIVTDHHEPPDKLPNAYVMINPKICDYPFKDLAGVGVAFKLAQAIYILLHKKDEVIRKYLDLVALGTIADSVSILGENRILVKYGLDQLVKTHRIGLKLLAESYGDGNLSYSSFIQYINFNLIPVLNSTGRVGHSHDSVDLLLTDSSCRAQFLVKKMLKLNEERKLLTQKTLEEVREIARKENIIKKQRILILASDHWHPGIIGIVASRIMEEFSKPVIIISTSNGIGKGSGRNQGEFDFSKILFDCSGLLIRYGGHQYAAGITIDSKNIDRFNEIMNKNLEQVMPVNLESEPVIHIDTIINYDTINWKLMNFLEKLRPFGPGNPQPIFCGYDFPLSSWKRVGKDEKHLKLVFGNTGTRDYLNGIAFQMAEKSLNFNRNDRINIAFHLETNCWNGNESIQLNIKDIK
ncbi:MAG: single-stranded-DNA-specific exonuclease RecJ [Candidatus Atribacteria bacterium]|nr:single-stranded-DNA-specific exonuclease RecJ [Candidatus Atribacteria bacterium]